MYCLSLSIHQSIFHHENVYQCPLQFLSSRTSYAMRFSELPLWSTGNLAQLCYKHGRCACDFLKMKTKQKKLNLRLFPQAVLR